jgi:hypothetical protein
MHEPMRASIEDALEEARHLLRLLYGLGAIEPGDDAMRILARNWLMHAKSSWLVVGGDEKVREYLLRLLSEKSATSRAKRGRPSNVDRNFWIVRMLARLVVKYGVPLTRSRRRTDDVRLRRRSSACAIVAQALGELGIKLDEAGVEAIWSKRRPQRSPREINDDRDLPRYDGIDWGPIDIDKVLAKDTRGLVSPAR